AVVLGTLDGAAVRVLRTFPYVAPDTVRHDAASQLRWLDSTTIVYLADRVGYERPCQRCPIDTLRTGVDVVRLDLSNAAASLAVVPGTRFASAVAAGESADIIYYTLGGDARVYRRVLSTGTVSVAHDFGTGIARDVQVVGSRLIAVVGGDVSFAFDSALGYPIQRDRGGPLVLVDLASGADTDAPGGYRIREVRSGWHRVRSSQIGYQATARDSVLVQAGAAVTVDFALQPQAVAVSPVTVQARPDVVLDPLATATTQRL